MAVVYIEARPKGRIEGTPVTDYVVEDHAAAFWQHSKHEATRYSGPKGMATRHMSPAFAI
jgi:hypothetical protein